MTETESIPSPFEAEPVKFYEDVSLLNFLDFDMYHNTELEFITQFDGFDALDVALLNYKNYTEEEVEVIKKLIIERDTKLQKSRGRNVHEDYPDTELFDDLDYTFSKIQVSTENNNLTNSK